jgi:hypothetical protein
LSSVELCLLFYSGVTGEGKEGFRPLIERYGLLKHVAQLDLLSPDHMEMDFYSKDAFLGYEERRAPEAAAA